MGRLNQTEGLTEVQSEILRTVRDFVTREIIPVAQRMEAVADRFLPQVAVDAGSQPKRVRIRDLIGGDHPRTAGRSRVEPFSDQPIEEAVAFPLGARRVF